ncbi:hypothetical protein Bbelb_221900 [Branchiostoma belcheri]|nr:hypothetical protein Bbelb_221900 [Branchiostoma belcheri]
MTYTYKKTNRYDTMLRCWQWEEDDRPEFEELYDELDAVVETMAEGYVKPGSGSPVGGQNEAAEGLETWYKVPKSRAQAQGSEPGCDDPVRAHERQEDIYGEL